jgi:TatD DNase family protein
MLVDVHCHLDFEGLRERIDEVIENAKKAGVKSIITSGVNFETNKLALEYAEKYDIVKASFGLYPPDALEREGLAGQEIDIDKQLKFLEENKDKFIAIGEIGLDLHSGKDLERQEEAFKKILKLAKKLDKPVLIHSRKAEERTIEILEELEMKKVIMHCFCGKKSLVKRAYENKYFFSIPCIVTKLQQFQNMVDLVDINHLLTETDAPFLSPYKDQKNEPAFITETIKKIAEIKKMDQEEVKKNIWMNYQRLFL